MPFKGRPYDEVFSDLDEFNNTLAPFEDKIAHQQEIIDTLLAACQAMLETLTNQGLDWFNTPILAEIEQMQIAIAACQPELDD